MPTAEQVAADVLNKYQQCATYLDEVEVRAEVIGDSILSSRSDNIREALRTYFVRHSAFRFERSLETARGSTPIATILSKYDRTSVWSGSRNHVEHVSLSNALSFTNYEVPRLLFEIESTNLSRWHNMRLVGMEAVNDCDCYCLEVLPDFGEPLAYYVGKSEPSLHRIVHSYCLRVNDPTVRPTAPNDRIVVRRVWHIRRAVFDHVIDPSFFDEPDDV